MLTYNESWIVDVGGAVIEKRDVLGKVLSPVEHLIFCLWVADYGMRNAGDLETACDVHETFQVEAYQLSSALGLVLTQSTFALSRPELEEVYFERFEAICEEIQKINDVQSLDN